MDVGPLRRTAGDPGKDGGDGRGIRPHGEVRAGGEEGRGRVRRRVRGGGAAQGRKHPLPEHGDAGHGLRAAGGVGAVPDGLRQRGGDVLHAQPPPGEAAPEAGAAALPRGGDGRVRGRGAVRGREPGHRLLRRHDLPAGAADVLAEREQGRRLRVPRAGRAVAGPGGGAVHLPRLEGHVGVACVVAGGGRGAPRGDEAGRPDGKAGHRGGVLPDARHRLGHRGVPARHLRAVRGGAGEVHLLEGLDGGGAGDLRRREVRLLPPRHGPLLRQAVQRLRPRARPPVRLDGRGLPGEGRQAQPLLPRDGGAGGGGQGRGGHRLARAAGGGEGGLRGRGADGGGRGVDGFDGHGPEGELQGHAAQLRGDPGARPGAGGAHSPEPVQRADLRAGGGSRGGWRGTTTRCSGTTTRAASSYT